MNLSTLEIPKSSEEMIKKYREYYGTFYLEMVRISNVSFNQHVKDFIDLISRLAKSGKENDVIRSAIGVVALYEFGYNDFNQLSSIFDRLLPQKKLEYVKFTSWCAGQLTHHPTVEQSRYASLLFARLTGWTRSKGRRNRNLAAAHLLDSLSLQCGMVVVVFFPALQSIIWHLLSDTSLEVLKATASAINNFTFSIIRYTRSDLNTYLDFFSQIIPSLLNYGESTRKYTALLLLRHLMTNAPDYYLPKFRNLYDLLIDTTYNESIEVQSISHSVMAYLSQVDPKQFINTVSERFFDWAPSLLSRFPRETVDSLCILIRNVPNFMKTRINELKNYSESLIAKNESDSLFPLLRQIFLSFGSEAMEVITEEMIMSLIKAPMSQEFKEFTVTFCNMFSDKYLNDTQKLTFSNRLKNELSSPNPLNAIKIIAEIPCECLVNHNEILEALNPLKRSSNKQTRCAIPAAYFNVGKLCKNITHEAIVNEMFKIALYDHALEVRVAALNVLNDHTDKTMATPGFMKFFQVFVNDDATSVKQATLAILEKLIAYNPVMVTAITRNCLLDSFFIIRNVPSIRSKSRSAKCLPAVVKASKKTIKLYSCGLMEIAIDVFKQRANQNQKFENFLEVHAYDTFLIGIINTVALLAPIDPDQVSKHAEFLIMFLSRCIECESNRNIILSVLNLLFVLLSAPSSSLLYRAKAPLILSSVTSLLAKTDSLNERLALLKVIGAIGVLELHQKPTLLTCVTPPNIDDSLARQFYHPSRDYESELDDSNLLNDETIDQYYKSFVANSVLEIFKDESLKEFYPESVQALVSIFKERKNTFTSTVMLSYFDMFVERLLEVMMNASDYDLKEYLKLFATLINNMNDNISPFARQSLEFIQSRFTQELSKGFVSVIVALLNSLKDGFTPYASETICLLIGIFENSKTTDAHLCQDVLNAFSILGVYASDLLYLIVPQICEAIETGQTLSKVRISAFNVLAKLSKSVDLFPYLGPLMRAASVGLFTSELKTRAAAFEFLYTLLMAQGSTFLKRANPIIQKIKHKNLETAELKQIIEKIKNGEYGTSFKPLLNQVEKDKGFDLTDENEGPRVFSEDAITSKAMTPSLGREQHLEQWLHSFMLTVVSNSPSEEIRACTTLAASYSPLSEKLFNIAFLSCWKQLSDLAKAQITQSFRDLLVSSDTYDTVNHEIIKLLVFMDKIEYPLEISVDDLVKSSIRYGGAAFALHLITRDIEVNPDNINRIEQCIDLYARLNSWDDAIGMWKKSQMKSSNLNKVEVLAKLKMWDVVNPIYQKVFKKFKNFDSFFGMCESFSALATWDELLYLYDTFKTLKRSSKVKVASFFAEASLRLGKWDILDEILEIAPEDSLSCTRLAALNAIHKNQFDKAGQLVERGFTLIASSPIAFLADNQQIHREIMLKCQDLVEINELRSWIMDVNRKEIEGVWTERLKTSPRDFDLWFEIIGNRSNFANIDNNIIKLFSMKSATLGTKLLTNAFYSLFPNFSIETATDLQKLCSVVVEWNNGNKKEALEDISVLLHSFTGQLLLDTHYIYANWVLEGEDTTLESYQDAYNHLKAILDSGIKNDSNKEKNKITSKRIRRSHSESTTGLIIPAQIFKELTSNTTQVDLLRKWSDVNASLAPLDKDNAILYVTNAINSLARCAQLQPSFQDIVLLLNLFFEHADISSVFISTAHMCIESLPPKLLLQASPQLLVQLSHPTKDVADFVHNIVMNLLDVHFHELLFSIIVLTKSKNSGRSRAANTILEEFKMKHPVVYDEGILIRKCMLRAAITWPEMLLNQIIDAFEHFKHEQFSKMRKTLEAITEMGMKERAKCPMHVEFQKEYGENLKKLKSILESDSTSPCQSPVSSPGRNNNEESSKKWISEATSLCKKMQDKLTEKIKGITTIRMSAISPELCERTHFKFAVFGTYKPNHPIIPIQYFVGQFSVIMTKQQPKDVIVKGEDGNFYQYLLKGHEDLRLDERIMQFFRLINSLLRKKSSLYSNFIQTICVIPLSLGHGLVQWVSEAATLRQIVEDYRILHGINPLIEYDLANAISESNYDHLKSIQKMQILEWIFNDIPDTDIGNSFWLKAANAEAWLKRTSTFAISTAINSIVGYIIGLGDRHPSNLLIDNKTGKTIHIDFGDCFEKAMHRKILPEVVPFRLTRMMVKAFGASGADGLFRSSFIEMSSLLRENSRVLILVLAVFVHEPLIDPEELEPNAELMQWASASGIQAEKMIIPKELVMNVASSTEIRKRVGQKLSGNDIEKGKSLSVEDQATILIDKATSIYSMSQMYSGWCPFW